MGKFLLYVPHQTLAFWLYVMLLVFMVGITIGGELGKWMERRYHAFLFHNGPRPWWLRGYTKPPR